MSDSDEIGLSIALSPIQLAAVLDGTTLSREDNANPRFWASVQLLGGALELVGAAALILVPEPTMATKVGGGALAVHGSDTISTALQQLFTGRTQTTITARTAELAARSLGVDPRHASTVGAVVDMAIPFAAGFAGAARITAVRRGSISLAAEERAGGHTIEWHVELTEARLRSRLVEQKNLKVASSFRNLNEAEQFISKALRMKRDEILHWSASATPGMRRGFDFAAGENVGYGVVRATGEMVNMQTIRVVLEKTSVGDKVYFILTAYPKL